jgi:hypothetical protein
MPHRTRGPFGKDEVQFWDQLYVVEIEAVRLFKNYDFPQFNGKS